MTDTGSILASLAFALLAAGLSGAVAARLGQSVILGYIVAGVAVGPHTPGFVADAGSVNALAEIGVVLLLFATGMEVSARDLMRVGRVALVGAHVQVVVLIGIGYLVGIALGWGTVPSLFLGAVVSNSSTTVLTKVLGERGEGGTRHARIGIAWSSVQDLTTIVLVVLLTAVSADAGVSGRDVLVEVAKAAVFLTVLVPVGGRVLPPVFGYIRQIRQREVFVLSAAALGLMTAYTATLFGLSPALGAFVAGVVLAESDIRHEVLNGLSPLRDIFAGLFFVSIGMLVDPGFLVANALPVLAVLALIVPAKGLVVGLLAAAFRLPLRTALMSAITLAQSAEFSFLLASLGRQLDVLEATEFSSLIAGAILSVVLLPGLLHLGGGVADRLDRRRDDDLAARPAEGAASEVMSGHAVICGHGRVGRIVTQALVGQGVPVAVLDQEPREILPLREAGHLALLGSADNEVLLARASVDRAALLVIAVPDRASVRRIVRFARQVNPGIVIVARTHELAERDYLETHGVDEAVVGELELALEMARFALRSSEIDPAAVDEYLDVVRHSNDGLEDA